MLIPTCMSAAPRSDGPTLPGGERQSPLVDAQRLAETTLRDPDVGQGDRAPDHVREVTGLLQARHAGGVPAARGLEIPARPGGERQEPGCASAPEVVVLADEVERPPGMGHGAGHIAEDQGLSGPVHGDRARQSAERRLVDDDHRARSLGGPVHGLVRRVEPPLGVPQPLLDALDLAPDEERPGVGVAQHGPDPEQLVGERLEPAAQRGLLAMLAPSPGSRARPGPPPARGPRPAIAWRIASDRSPFCSYHSLARRCSSGRGRAARPAGAPAARRRRGGGSDTTGAGRRAGRGTGSLDRAPPAWPCRPSWPVTASHSGPLSRSRIEVCSRKLRTSLGLTVQDLLDQVVDDVAVVPGEAGDEAGDVVAPLHRERRQLEGGDPALGARLQRGDIARRQLQPHHLVEVRGGLVRA